MWFLFISFYRQPLRFQEEDQRGYSYTCSKGPLNIHTYYITFLTQNKQVVTLGVCGVPHYSKNAPVGDHTTCIVAA